MNIPFDFVILGLNANIAGELNIELNFFFYFIVCQHLINFRSF